MKQAKYNGIGRFHGRKSPITGIQYTFRSDRWTDIKDDEDAAHFEENVRCLDVRKKPKSETVKEAAGSAKESLSPFLQAVKKAGGDLKAMLDPEDGMAYSQKQEAAEELGLDVRGNASHEDLNDAITSEVQKRREEGEL